jgi:hypothetical protein
MDSVCPGGKTVATEVADHLREGMHMAAGCSQLRASSQYFTQLPMPWSVATCSTAACRGTADSATRHTR